MGGQAAVAAGDRQSLDAAVAVLRAGGNAVDAAIGAGFAAAVAEPGLTSLGGGGFLLLRRPTGQTELIDFFVDTPGRGLDPGALTPHFTPVTVVFSDAEQVFHAGYGSVAVPGVLNGYLTAHRRLGRLTLADVVEPARALALSGVVLSPTQAEVLHLLKSILALTPEAAHTFLVNGSPPKAGDSLANPDYGAFLHHLGAVGPRSWAELPQTVSLLAAMASGGGLLTHDDLASYRVHARKPQQIEFRGARLTTNPPPSLGGSIVCAALRELDADQRTSAPPARALVEALHHATQAQKTQATNTPSSTKGTTHVSVIDADGMVASMTTSNGSCSGVLVPRTGVQLNNMMGEADLHPDGFHGAEPGTRVASMMAPSLLDLTDGSVVAIGSGGSERIRSALLQTVTHLVAGMPLAQAVAAPRVHFDGTTSQLEPDGADVGAAELAPLGPVNRWSRGSMYFGGVTAGRRHPDGRREATGAARRHGAGAVVDL
ncbi:MAG: gamma-glutamyltransferase family protein [Actinomycetia bacterium]|nr:gamma-glutamyltransferase family protein [Actinomycetes bacterium]